MIFFVSIALFHNHPFIKNVSLHLLREYTPVSGRFINWHMFQELNSPYDACVVASADLTLLECLEDSDCGRGTCLRGQCLSPVWHVQWDTCIHVRQHTLGVENKYFFHGIFTENVIDKKCDSDHQDIRSAPYLPCHFRRSSSNATRYNHSKSLHTTFSLLYYPHPLLFISHNIICTVLYQLSCRGAPWLEATSSWLWFRCSNLQTTSLPLLPVVPRHQNLGTSSFFSVSDVVLLNTCLKLCLSCFSDHEWATQWCDDVMMPGSEVSTFWYIQFLLDDFSSSQNSYSILTLKVTK